MAGFGSLNGSTKVIPPAEVGGLKAYDAAKTYSKVNPDYVEYGSKIWKYINATPAAGVTPVEGLYWKEVSAEALVHAQGTDRQLLRSNNSPLTADEIYALLYTRSIDKVAWVSNIGSDAGGVMGNINKPFKTIQAAINSIAIPGFEYEGGKVIVSGGNYTENITQNSKHYLVVDLIGNAKLTGNITTDGHQLFLVSSDKSGVFEGKFINSYSLALYILNLRSMKGLAAGPLIDGRHGKTVYIEGVEYITTASTEMFQAGNYYLKNVRQIVCDGGPIFNNVGSGGNSCMVYHLSNIGYMWAKVGRLGQSTEFRYAHNVTMRSQLRIAISQRPYFQDCRLISDTEDVFQCWTGGRSTFVGCAFQSAKSYALSAYNANTCTVEARNTARNCATLFDEANAGLIIRAGGNNSYDSTLTISTTQSEY